MRTFILAVLCLLAIGEQSNATPPFGVPCDYNNNGIVDAADYVLWRNGGPLQNEIYTPGSCTVDDYTCWTKNFGNTSAASGSSQDSGSFAAPEPAAWALLLSATIPLFFRRALMAAVPRGSQ